MFISYRPVNAPCRLLKPFMACKEIFATCYENYAAYVNTLCGQDVEIFNITHLAVSSPWDRSRRPRGGAEV
jgi:hypothetical protein